jgi:hypothetical protein
MFNIVHLLIQSKTCLCLALRFAFIYLNRLINTLKKQTKAGYIKTYLNFTNNLLYLLSKQLIKYAQKSKRWLILTSLLPL